MGSRINGKDILVLLQLAKAPLGAEGLLLGSQTESNHSIEAELSEETTVFGAAIGAGTPTETMEFVCYGERKDPGQMAAIQAIKKGEQLKVWFVDRVPNENGKHDADFGYTYVESVEKDNPNDSFQEISITTKVINTSKSGELDAMPAQLQAAMDYLFEKPGAKTGEFGTQPVTEPVVGG